MTEALSIAEIKEQLYEFFRTHFPTPAHLLNWLDDDLLSNKYSLHKWQSLTHTKYFSITATESYTQENPLELCIRAVNGSGKDEKVITAFVLHFLATNKDALCVLTSASGQQLKTQTEKYLRRYSTILNAKLSNMFKLEETYEFFVTQQRSIKCEFTDGDCVMFATDEAGKAEGFHPTRSGAKFAIIVNEGKSIEEPIWEALSRCNGFTHWIEISSPGRPDGHFFRTCTSTRIRTTSNGTEENAVVQIVVTANDCPHLGGKQYVDRLVDVYGSRDHYMVKSMVDADFSSAEEQVVISYDKYNRLLKYQHNCEHLPSLHNDAGLDLAFGGDEICMQVRNGNKHVATEKLISKDTNVICNTIHAWILKHNLEHGRIYADAGGLGEPIISLLRGPAYAHKNIISLKNNYTAKNENAYKNLGTEMWFEIAKLIEEQEIILKDDDILRKQICNRYYKINSDNTSQLESKQHARGKGRPSPDRADALALCFYKYTTPAVSAKRKATHLRLVDLANSKILTAPTIGKFIRESSTNSQLQKYMAVNGIVNARTSSRVAERGAIKLELQQAMRNIFGNN